MRKMLTVKCAASRPVFMFHLNAQVCICAVSVAAWLSLPSRMGWNKSERVVMGDWCKRHLMGEHVCLKLYVFFSFLFLSGESL